MEKRICVDTLTGVRRYNNVRVGIMLTYEFQTGRELIIVDEDEHSVFVEQWQEDILEYRVHIAVDKAKFYERTTTAEQFEKVWFSLLHESLQIDTVKCR